MDLPVRKPNRLPHFDYNTPGAYFITICTKDRKNLLGKVVGGGDLDAPHIVPSHIGTMADTFIKSGERMPHIHIDKYVIMPNHIHIILFVEADFNGTSKAPSPTNAIIPHFVSTFKRFCHKEAGFVIFQRSYHDHIVRNEKDYLKIWEYIENNPVRWEEDCFYTEE